MRAVRFADECSKWTTPAQTFSSSGADFWARTQTRLPGKFFFLRPPADPPGPLRVLPRRGAQRQKEARDDAPHRGV